jgi:hypothetical protein
VVLYFRTAAYIVSSLSEQLACCSLCSKRLKQRTTQIANWFAPAEEPHRAGADWEKLPQVAVPLGMEVEAAGKPIPYLIAATMVPVSV